MCVCVCVCVCVCACSGVITHHFYPFTVASDLNNTVGGVDSTAVEGDNRSYNVSWTTIDPMEGSVSDRLLSMYRVTYSPVKSGGRRKRQASSDKEPIYVMRNETFVLLKNLSYFTDYKYDVSSVYRVNGRMILVPGESGSFKTGEGGVCVACSV